MDKPDIVYEDGNIIVCNKKAGVASQSERSFDNDLTSMLMTYLVSSGRKCNVHIINRLDKPVEGLVLYALNRKAAAGFGTFRRTCNRKILLCRSYGKTGKQGKLYGLSVKGSGT